MSNKLYTLWLPIENFDAIANKEKEKETDSNGNWDWIIFKDNDLDIDITIDSLGFFYIQSSKTQETQEKQKIAKAITKYIDDSTKKLIEETFICDKLQNNEVSLDEFIKSIIIEFKDDVNILTQFMHTSNASFSKKATLFHKNYLKISSSESNFENMLNRNFDQLLERSLRYTNKLKFDKGEIYSWIEIIGNYDKTHLDLKIKINDTDLDNKFSQEIQKQIFQKAIQNTIEEKTLQHFLKITQKKYLKDIFEKMSSMYASIILNNMKIVGDLESMQGENNNNSNTSNEEEEIVNSFTHALLQSIPLFHRVDSHLRESYYVKIGNTTNYAKVIEAETIKSTYQYRVWIHYINNFVETADRIKDSLRIYHDNRALKELEDIGYNGNYQADIEDIRDLKQKDIALDESTKNYIQRLVIVVAVLTLSATAPLVHGSVDKHTNWMVYMFCTLCGIVVSTVVY